SLRVSDAGGHTFDRPITVVVAPLHLLTQTSLPHATVGTAYSFTLTPYGGSSYAWAAANLPPGLTIDQSGQIFGTPTAAGTFFLSITLTDLPTSTSRTISITLIVDPFAITTGGVLPSGTVGVPYGNRALTAPGCGGTCTWSIAAGSLPSGMSFSTGGVL